MFVGRTSLESDCERYEQPDQRESGHRWLRPRRWLLALIVPAALVVAAFYPAAASAATRGFHVWNLSGEAMTLASVEHTQGPSNDSVPGPPVGSVISPGTGYQDFEVTYWFLQDNIWTVTYNVDAPGTGQVVYQFWVDGFGTDYSKCSAYAIDGMTGQPLVCAPTFNSANGGWNEGVADDYLYDAPGTVINVPAGQGQAQADTLKQFCSINNSATCTFNPTSEVAIYSPDHQVGKALENNTNVTQDTTITESYTASQTNSLEIDAEQSWTMFKVLSVKVAEKYGHSWTSSTTFSQAVTIHCPPHCTCQLVASDPYLRDTGDYTMTLGNTTWNLPGVYFDSPDPSRAGQGAYTINATPPDLCEGSGVDKTILHGKSGARTVRSGPYVASRRAERNRITKPKLHLTITEPKTVIAGSQVSYRVKLSRSQPSDRFTYALRNLRVRILARAAPRRWLVSSLAPFASRTLRLEAGVPGAARGRFCISAEVTAKNVRRARARACAVVAALSTNGMSAQHSRHGTSS